MFLDRVMQVPEGISPRASGREAPKTDAAAGSRAKKVVEKRIVVVKNGSV